MFLCVHLMHPCDFAPWIFSMQATWICSMWALCSCYGLIRQISSDYSISTVTLQKCFVKYLTHTAASWVTKKKSPTSFQLNKWVNKQHIQLQINVWNPINFRVPSEQVIGTKELFVKITPVQNCFCLGTTDFLNLFKSNSMCFPSALQLRVLD